MATFRICVFKHQVRKDGKYRVSVRLTHNRQHVYLTTDTYVVKKQIASDFKSLRDTDVVRRIDRDIFKYEELLLRGLGSNLNKYTAKELANYILKYSATEGGANIDFVEFSVRYIEVLKNKKRGGYKRLETVIRHLRDFYGKDVIYIREINGKNMEAFVEHLKLARKMTRINQRGNEYEITRPPVKDRTVLDYLGDIQLLFNAACDEYNDEDGEMMLITHNPFRKVSVKVSDAPDKRNLLVEDLIKIIEYTEGSGRCGLARDVFLLQFYLVGMNTADIFGTLAKISDGRLTYKRQKTTMRRTDKALISIKIEPEVESLIKKYKDPAKKRVFRFYRMYSDFRGFNQNLNKGLKQLASVLDIDPRLSTYFSRHTWATIASEDCGISDSDIGIALNHVGGYADNEIGGSLKVTRGYINRQWTKIDKMNRQVIDFVESKRER